MRIVTIRLRRLIWLGLLHVAVRALPAQGGGASGDSVRAASQPIVGAFRIRPTTTAEWVRGPLLAATDSTLILELPTGPKEYRFAEIAAAERGVRFRVFWGFVGVPLVVSRAG